jgi:Tfp pilus assembly protein PilF
MLDAAQTTPYREQRMDARPSKEGPAMKDDARSLWMTARLAHDRGDAEEAARLFRRLLKVYPVSHEATDAFIYLTTEGQRSAQRPQLDESW